MSDKSVAELREAVEKAMRDAAWNGYDGEMFPKLEDEIEVVMRFALEERTRTDEARRLHDEHCMQPQQVKGLPFPLKAGCTPPWRLR